MKYQSCHNSKNLTKTNQTTIITITKEEIIIRIKDSSNSNSRNQQQSKSSWKVKHINIIYDNYLAFIIQRLIINAHMYSNYSLILLEKEDGPRRF